MLSYVRREPGMLEYGLTADEFERIHVAKTADEMNAAKLSIPCLRDLPDGEPLYVFAATGPFAGQNGPRRSSAAEWM